MIQNIKRADTCSINDPIVENFSMLYVLWKKDMEINAVVNDQTLQQPHDDSDAELAISFNDINQCYQCLSNDRLCWFHKESVKTILVNDAKSQIMELISIK